MMPCAPFADPLLVDDAAELLPTLFFKRWGQGWGA
jgi:hypothetical protein